MIDDWFEFVVKVLSMIVLVSVTTIIAAATYYVVWAVIQ